MFDLTRLARTTGFVFLGYFACIPAGAILAAIVGVSTGKDLNLDFLWWGAVWVFPVLAMVLAVDFHRRLGSGGLTVTQVPGYGLVGGMMAFGAVFGLSVGVWVPVVITLCCLAALRVPTRSKAAPSTRAPK